MEQTNLLKVLSFNMKRDGFGRHNRWMQRREIAADCIQESGATIVGVQEVLPKMRRDIETLLKNYSIVGCGRYEGRKSANDEHSDILIDNTNADIDFYKTFWLSKRPEKSGSRGLLAMFPRICTMAEVFVKPLGCRIRVFNTHFDHISGFARTLGVRIILDYMHQFQMKDPLPIILMGDLNAKPDSYPIKILRHNLHFYPNIHLTDVYEAMGEDMHQNSYHHFSGKVKKGKEPIDYIFVSDDFEVVRSEFLTKNNGGQYPSDHFPVMATLRFVPS